MYTEYFQLKERPFKLTPDPGFLFLSDTHLEALNHLIYGITNREGFILITGDVGSGKTTLCRALLERLGTDTQTALILNPVLPEKEFMLAVLDDFGIEHRRSTKKEAIDQLNAFLLNQLELGKKAVLIIDEAQDLSISMLERIRLLSNLETAKEKLLQIILIGQDELRDKLNLPKLRQLRQRITVRYDLDYLNREETAKYIYYRLTTAGSTGKITFTRGAINTIFKYTNGVPRLINAAADRALLGACMKETNTITRRLALKGIRSLEGREERNKHTWSRWMPAAALSMLTALSGLYLVFR